MRSSRSSRSSAAVAVLLVPQPAAVNRRMPSNSSAAALRTARSRAGGVACGTAWLLGAEQVDHEDERFVGRDHGRRAFGAIGFGGRDDELAPSAHLHAGDAVVPAGDDLAA